METDYNFTVNGVTWDAFSPPGESKLKVTMEVTPSELKGMLDYWKWQEVVRQMTAWIAEMIENDAPAVRYTDLDKMFRDEMRKVFEPDIGGGE